jgi:hypothetical protein
MRASASLVPYSRDSEHLGQHGPEDLQDKGVSSEQGSKGVAIINSIDSRIVYGAAYLGMGMAQG